MLKSVSFSGRVDSSKLIVVSLSHFSKPNKPVYRDNYHFDHLHDDCDGGSVSRQTALEYVTKGGLMCEVKLLPIAASPWGFVPENPSACETIQQLFTDKESADVVFEVENIKFYAHSLLLKKASPLLAELCKSEDNSSPCIIHISGVSSNAFKYVLQYIYGCDSSDIGHDWFGSELIIEMIEVADKYGLTNLKLRAEIFFVGTVYIEFDNFMEYLQFAKSKNCYLLQEAVMDFIVENKIRILEKKMLEGAPDNITYNILSSMARREIERATTSKKNSSFSFMSLSELRRQAHARGLEVDGSREMLISALKRASTPASD